ncbi:MAG: CCA tRNA nucleotidyltransferase [Phycisphaerales bacterium]|nr:CCA tRNA nucleotidyltransferase [Phycisphaerales bacterium]
MGEARDHHRTAGAGDPRAAATGIVRILRDAGHVAYFAGGCVRDELLGLHPADYDVATDAPPERVIRLFPRTREVGKAFGVVLVRPRGAGHDVEVATFRREHGYTDKRRPDAVHFTDAREDAFRRDFTINALFIDPLDESERPGGRVIDFVGGRDDLAAGVVRAVGDPNQRLAEDHLRALRAARFAARLRFRIDPATAEAIRAHAAELAGVSRERIGDELRLMLAHPARAAAAASMQHLGLDAPALGQTPRPGRPLPLLESLPGSAAFEVALAAWSIDRHPDPSPDRLRADLDGLCSRLRSALTLSNAERDRLHAAIATLVRLRLPAEADAHGWHGNRVARQKRLAASHGFADACLLLRGIDPDAEAAVRARAAELAATPGGLAPAPLVTGDALVAAGFAPGPAFGKWLENLYDLQLEGALKSPEQGISLVRAWAGPSPA